MIIVASLHLHVAWYVVLLLLLLLPSFLLRSSNFGTRHESGRKRESRVNGSHRGGKSGKRRNPISQRRKRASIATYRHPSRALPSKGKAGGESSSHLDESVTRSIQYSTFAKRPPSSDFYLSNSTIHHTEYFNNFSSTNLCAPKVSHLWRKFFLRIFLEKKRKIYNISLLNF